MINAQKNRALLTAMGILAALAFYVWVKVISTEIWAAHSVLFGAVATAVFFSALLAIGPRMVLARAALYAGGLALGVAALMWLSLFRFEGIEGLARAAYPVVCAFVLTALPLPFFIAHQSGNWRDYATLFEQSWDIVLRYAIGLVLIGAVWVLIYLSEMLLSLVGLNFLDLLLDLEIAPYLITGAAGGFGMAVAAETLAPMGAGLALLLLRPLLPLITAVVAVFLLALPLRGLSNLFGEFSAAGTLMAIAAVGAALVSAVVDARHDAASRSKILSVSARLMGGMLLIIGLLACIAMGQRILQYGWTPARLLAAMGAAISLSYGAFYAAAILRRDWMARVRFANVANALILITFAALLISPVLNVEKIAASSQMARFVDGRTKVKDLDIRAFENWGRAGQAAVADLTAQSKQPGNEDLAAKLANPYGGPLEAFREDDLRRDLLAALPVQPATAKAAQSLLLRKLDTFILKDIHAACNRAAPDGSPLCAMVIADFLPTEAGDEGVVAYLDGDTLRMVGFTQERLLDGGNEMAIFGNDRFPTGDEAKAILRAWQAAPPVLTPAPINQIPFGPGSVALVPLR